MSFDSLCLCERNATSFLRQTTSCPKNGGLIEFGQDPNLGLERKPNHMMEKNKIEGSLNWAFYQFRIKENIFVDLRFKR